MVYHDVSGISPNKFDIKIKLTLENIFLLHILINKWLLLLYLSLITYKLTFHHIYLGIYVSL